LPRQRIVTVPYGFERASDAVSVLLRRSGWKVTENDKEAGHFEVELKLDLLAFPETFVIQLIRTDDANTEVFMGGTIRYYILDMGITGAYLDSFFKKLDQILKENQT
jgi:hypothetical protein